jgi:hypothetical protein
MAIPTITSVTPTRGHSGGGQVIKIVGTNFALPPPPPPTGIVPEAPPTVRVFIGGTEARLVRVASATTLYVTTERRDPAKELALEVRNVGPHGETIGAEVATLPSAYEYARPIFTGEKSDIERVTRVLMLELIRQVYPEVVLTAHVDWTDAPEEILRGVREAKLPSLFLAGPTMRPNVVYRTNVSEKREIAPGTGVFVKHRAPDTDDLVFTLGAIADNLSITLSLMGALADFTKRNPFLLVPRAEGSSEIVRFELMREGEITLDSANTPGNLRTCSGTIAVVAVDTLVMPGFENDQAITAVPDLTDDIEIGVERR